MAHHDLGLSLFNLLEFIEEQLERARSDPTERYAAVDAASGVIPFIRKRLEGDEELTTQFLLVFDAEFYDHWKEWWGKLAKANADEFEDEAARLIHKIQFVKTNLDPSGSAAGAP